MKRREKDTLLRKQVMSDSLTSVHTDMNCCFHCVTAIEVLQMTALAQPRPLTASAQASLSWTIQAAPLASNQCQDSR
eukprot:1276180-Rhodomonas_salina.8